MEYYLRSPIREWNGGALVRLSDDARRCVVYLGYSDPLHEDRIDPTGTGFLVHTGETRGGYLITARHVAKALGGDPFSIRFNDKNGHGRSVLIDSADWEYHPDGESVDVAVMEFEPPRDVDIMWFPTTAFLTEEKLESKNIGAGDLAYVVGVFHPLHGASRNLPVVHTGTIALMPEDEPIPVFAWEDPILVDDDKRRIVEVNGYIIQVDTLPGSSGAPVFVRRSLQGSFDQFMDGLNALDKNKAWLYGAVFLLGVWQGAWGDDPAQVIALPKGKHARRALGMGTAMPAERILDVINGSKFQKRREDAAKEIKRKNAVFPQSAPPTTEDNPQHREDFNSLLDAAVGEKKPDQ